MTKILAWVLSFTKVGKVVEPVQRFLSGKKAYLAGAALVVPAAVSIATKFADQGLPYVMTISHTPEFDMLMQGIGIMGLRAAITKAANPAKDPNANG